MTTTLVLSVIGNDRAGLVKALADVIEQEGGNWERSHLSELAGKFAGIVVVTVPGERADGLRAALKPLHGLLDVAVHDATVTLGAATDTPVEPDVLMTLARASRDHEHVSATYTDIRGTVTQRRLEPYQLVTTGRRWYLMCFDRDRDDWRSLRLDRMAQVRVAGTTFTPREAPDAASYVRRAISSSPYPYVARVRYVAASDVVAQVFPTASVHIEADGPDTCIVTTGADDPERMVPWLAMPGCDFEVLEPPEVVDAVRTVAGRIARAVAG